MDNNLPEPPFATPFFWREDSLPFIEARSVGDGRNVCYARHSHDVFSIGAITAGASTYLHEKTSQTVVQGAVVLMNPGAVHACNPIADKPWSYVMLYVDSLWLGTLQAELRGDDSTAFAPLAATSSTAPCLYAGLRELFDVLVDPALDALYKECAALSFFSVMQRTLGDEPRAMTQPAHRVDQAAQYIDAHFTDSLRLGDICAAASLSASHLIRAFEQRYHMTPHAYLLNRRIQHARTQLKRGRLIADVALETGFADQAHFQREFKKHMAATPGQYKLELSPASDKARSPPAARP